MRANDHLGLGDKLIDTNLAEGVVVEEAGGVSGGKAPHEVACVDVEDILHGGAVGNG